MRPADPLTRIGLGPLLRLGVRAAILAASCATIGLAQQYDLSWYTMDNGGGTATGKVYQIHGTIGQPDAGDLAGKTYMLSGGFWPPLAAGDCNGDLQVDLTDHAGLSGCLEGPSGGTGPPCACFDLDETGTIDLADFAAFQSLLEG